MTTTTPARVAGTRADVEACVLGDVDLVAALGAAGVPSVAVVGREDPAAFSRFVRGRIEPLDHWREPAALVDRLLTWSAGQSRSPVLYYQTDGDLLMVSRYRFELAAGFRFVLADAGLVESLVDKAAFARLAARLGLRVPASCELPARGSPASACELGFPLVLKPLSRQGLGRLEPHAKALLVDSPRQLDELWPRVVAADVDVLAQQLVPGPETRVESYHAYVDQAGEVAGEFTGIKVRTYPPTFGHSTALRTSDAPDVMARGRADLAALGLRGVVKVDYKRDPEDDLWLLEVNPRFTLWHHLGAAAGVNLAALVHADLTGRPRPAPARARAGVGWCHPWEDRWAAAAAGIGRGQWARETLHCAARTGADLRDPLPFVRGMVWPRMWRPVRERVARRRRPAGERSR